MTSLILRNECDGHHDLPVGHCWRDQPYRTPTGTDRPSQIRSDMAIPASNPLTGPAFGSL